MKLLIHILFLYTFLFAQFVESSYILFDGNKHLIKFNGNPRTSKLVTNNAIDFDGIDDIGKILDLSLLYSKGFTISFWVKPLGFIIDGDEDSYLLCNAYKDGNVYWALKLTNQTAGSAKICFSFASLDSYYEVKSQTDISLNQMYHVTCVYAKNKISIYIDGKKDAAKNIKDFDFGEENLELTVGAGVFIPKEKNIPVWVKDIPCAERENIVYGYFNGIIDDIKIFNKILDDDEIIKNYKTITNTIENQKVKIIVHEPTSTRGLRLLKGKLTVKGEVTPANVAKKVVINDKIVTNYDGKYFSQDLLLTKDINKIHIQALDKNNNILDEISFEYVIEDEKKITQKQSYYALIIGCQNYKDKKIDKLDYPIKNGNELLEVLSKYYNFDISKAVFLKDATYDEIIKNLDKLNKNVTPNDNLLIFFAGHGIYDKNQDQGYWLSIDANLESRSKWISNAIIKDYLKGNKANSILVISDACFSGALIKTRSISSSSKYIEEMTKNKSRKALTSGVLSVVPDKSVFMEYLLKELKTNNDLYLPAEVLYFRIKEKVVNNSPISQIPMYGEIYNTGDEGGDFVFIKKFAK